MLKYPVCSTICWRENNRIHTFPTGICGNAMFRAGFELMSPCPFPSTITITPRAPPILIPPILIPPILIISYKIFALSRSSYIYIHMGLTLINQLPFLRFSTFLPVVLWCRLFHVIFVLSCCWEMTTRLQLNVHTLLFLFLVYFLILTRPVV